MYDPPIEPCSRCAGIDVVSDTAAGDIVCRSCGEIQASRIIDYSAEWREFAEDDRGKNGSAARSSCTADKFGSSGTEFAGGVSESARAALVKAQMQVTDKRELKIGKTAVLISNIGSTLQLTRRIMVSFVAYLI
jgi:transcription initiation factor TFIIIB Brf1 subunit/transcription initiation factor TFIIB